VTPAVAPPAGRRERTKAANRAAILEAALAVFGELGYDAAGVRDIVRRTGLASGTFYNYFPDKAAVLRAVVEATAAEARRRVRRARQETDSPRDFAEAGFRAYFEFVAEDAATRAFLRRNVALLRAEGLEHVLPLGVEELRVDLVALGVPGLDADYCATAMVAAGIELGVRMAEHEPPDVEGATRFATALFAGVLSPRP
jgi:AcrR family transcriptional regulator